MDTKKPPPTKEIETFFRRLEILRFLQSKRAPQPEQAIRHHLDRQGCFRIKNPDDSREEPAKKKAVQRDLTALWECSRYNQDIDKILEPAQDTFIIREGTQHSGYTYKIGPDSMGSLPGPPTTAQALALTITHKFLGDFIHSDHFEEIHPQLLLARQTLEKKVNPLENWAAVPKRLAILQRGHPLFPSSGQNEEWLDVIYKAIAENRCIEGRYQGLKGEHTVQLSPLGVVFRLPKEYLIGIKRGDDKQLKRQFLIQRFVTLEVSRHKSEAPKDFNLASWLNDGGMDVAVFGNNETKPPRFDVRLRIFAPGSGTADNMIRDMEESRLAENQIGPTLQDDGTWLVTLPDRVITHQLIEWVLGRGPRVQVLSPPDLENRVIEHLNQSLSLYSSQ
ncbi:WYL domain-containing protein [Alcanivorax sp.]|jgi:hypothetical protein|uniref:helix-turn-helix transcriptional regulator n=1 Tax=Alcanivorax sp. TaxID=1872427 RepID=UPI0032D8FF20